MPLRGSVDLDVAVPRAFDVTGFDVQDFVSFKPASARSRDRRPFIALDLGMPRLDGFDALALVRSKEQSLRLPSSPAFAVTGRTTPQDRGETLAAGFVGHISKPVVLADLSGAMAMVAALRSATQRTRYSVDAARIGVEVAAMFPRESSDHPDRLQAIMGFSLAVERECSETLRGSFSLPIPWTDGFCACMRVA